MDRSVNILRICFPQLRWLGFSSEQPTSFARGIFLCGKNFDKKERNEKKIIHPSLKNKTQNVVTLNQLKKTSNI